MATSTQTKLKEGAWYRVRFLDHCIAEKEELVTCRVYGWLVSQDKERVTISTWEIETDDKELRDNNKELINIIRSSITEIRKVG